MRRLPRVILALFALSGIPARAQDTSTPPPPQAEAGESRPAEVEVEIFFRDGRRLQGIVASQTDDTITILVNGIPTPFPRKDVLRLRTLESVEEQYVKRRAAIDDRDLNARLMLADWLRDRERFVLALIEVDGVLAMEPGHLEALELRRLIEQQKLLAASRKASSPKPAASPTERMKPRPDFPTLSDRDINLIRIFEIDLDASPRLNIPRDTITTLLDAYAGREGIPTTREGRDAFYRKPPAEILGVMFSLRARELYPQVQVLDSPRALRLFRESVHRNWLINSCATTACHGGDDAGRLYLDNRHGHTDRAVYTNFLILDRFVTASGLKLIDYAEPARSPLLQAALPRDIALFKHPDVRVGPTKASWRPAFESVNDRRFKDAVEWISGMYQPRPEYPIEYQPPTPRNYTPKPPPNSDTPPQAR